MRLNAIGCDCCGRGVNVRDAWVTWWADTETMKASRVWLTCHPSGCIETRRALHKEPKGFALMDHYATVIARQFDTWAARYMSDVGTVAKLAMRISPLLEEEQAKRDYEESLEEEVTP